MDQLLVMKFGGTSVGDAPRLREVIDITRNARAEGHKVVLVCSAVAGVTNNLINLARAAANGHDSFEETIKRELWAPHRSLADMVLYDDWEREALFGEWTELSKQLERLLRSLVTLRDLSGRSLDAVSSLGERWSARLVAALLRAPA